MFDMDEGYMFQNKIITHIVNKEITQVLTSGYVVRMEKVKYKTR